MPVTFDRAKRVAMLVILGMLLAPVPGVLANALPTSKVWLLFDYQTSQRVRLEGFQIIGYDTPGCNQGRLIRQYGRCESGVCWAMSSGASAQDLECLGDRCIVVLYGYPIREFECLKVVGQFSDRVRESSLLRDEEQS